MKRFDPPAGYRRAIRGIDKRTPETLVRDDSGEWVPLGRLADGSDLFPYLDYAVKEGEVRHEPEEIN